MAMAEASWIGIVDDDPSVLKALKRLLGTRAFDVRTYGSGQAFLAALPNGLPACLILDLQMPEMSGLELLQDLARRKLRIPTIIITAQYDAELRARCESTGVLAILSKPLQDKSLFAAINNATGAAKQPHSGPWQA
jgi:FixJ family two-component response regulator